MKGHHVEIVLWSIAVVGAVLALALAARTFGHVESRWIAGAWNPEGCTTRPGRPA